MERWLVRVGLAVAANAIALLVAAVLLDKFTIDELEFLWAVIIFTLVSLGTSWVVHRVIREKAPAAASVAGLITTWIALLITDLVSEDIQIEGVGTWILATLIVWGAYLVLEWIPGPWRREAQRRNA